MKNLSMGMLCLPLLATITTGFAGESPAPSHGIAYPQGWQHWSAIAVSHRLDNHTVRTILGNDIAVKAARSGNTNPWPDGAILGKVVWKETRLKDWEQAVGPDKFVHAEFMFKDANKNTATPTVGAGRAGWGWSRSLLKKVCRFVRLVIHRSSTGTGSLPIPRFSLSKNKTTVIFFYGSSPD